MLLLQAATSPRAASGAGPPTVWGGLGGPHRTFSPSVSCTAMGSAPRLALPLAWAICRYMDVCRRQQHSGGRYAAAEEGPRKSPLLESCCTTATNPPPHPRTQTSLEKRLSSHDVELPQLLHGRRCVTVLDRMVEKTTTGLHPVVVSIKDFTVGYIY